MIEKLKQYWYIQYKIGATKLFREFIDLLSKGGNQAITFYNENEPLVQSLLANPHRTDSLDAKSLKKLLTESLKQPVENQRWFFEQAKAKLSDVKHVLAEKYHGTVRYAQELGINLSESTPESLWLDLCNYEPKSETQQEQEPNSDPNDETKPEPASKIEKDKTGEAMLKEELLKVSPEDEFKVRLTEMVGVGMTDAEIWEVVKDEAKELKLSKTKVLAELASMHE